MKKLTALALGALGIFAHGQAQAFCGFFVSKAGADLFNQASKVVMARADDRTVITMANDFQGDLKEFAIVIPVPEVLEEGQVNVTENRLVEHIDAYTAPRLVEYFDPDPCTDRLYQLKALRGGPQMMAMEMVSSAPIQAEDYGVTIEAEYTVGEYDIVILSAEESDGLLGYLNQEGYKLPQGAEKTLGSYIKQDMKFFLAKVNLEEQAKSGYTYLRPLQVAFESEKFMLPIRLGTLNAKGDQDLILYTLTRQGRVETTNYRTVKIPSDTNIPVYVKDEFGEFYKAMFDIAAEKEQKKVTFLEYAWNMSWCDPCAADPLPNKDLRTLGAWWIEAPKELTAPKPLPGAQQRIMPMPPQAPANAYVTRLHVRYNAETFPEDLILQETVDNSNFQGRYVLNHTFEGNLSCKAGQEYLASLPQRHEKEAQNLAQLTGWDVNDIRQKMKDNGRLMDKGDVPPPTPWWKDIWTKD